MNIKFSRHSKRRIQLYKINENDIVKELNNSNAKSNLRDGKITLIEENKSNYKYQYPLKIIFEKNKNDITVITVYPLKRGKK